MFDLNTVFSGISTILLNAVGADKATAEYFLSNTKKRFSTKIYNVVQGNGDYKQLVDWLLNEKDIVLNELLALGVIAGEQAEELVNELIVKAVDMVGSNMPVVPFATKGAGTTYGVFTAGELSPGDVITVAQKLGCTAVRLGLNMDSWTGRNTGIEQVQAAGLKVYLNVNWKTVRTQEGIRMPQPFLALNETADYEKTLTEILAKYKDAISLLVIENEETVNLFHSGTAEDYVYELSVAYKIAKKFGVRITNGGLVNPQLQILTYRNLVEESRIVAANDFYDNCMDSRTKKMAKYRNNNEMEAKVAETEYLLNNYAVLTDVVNLHWYEPLIEKVGIFNWFENDTQFSTPGALSYIVEYLKKVTGKEVVCNEVGILNAQPGLVTSVLKDFQKSGIKELCWSSFTSDNGKVDPLNNGTELNNLGLAFANFLK